MLRCWACSYERPKQMHTQRQLTSGNLFCLAGGEARSGIALVPVADMLDHEPSRHMAWHAGRMGDDDFHFISHTPVPKARLDPYSCTPAQPLCLRPACCLYCLSRGPDSFPPWVLLYHLPVQLAHILQHHVFLGEYVIGC